MNVHITMPVYLQYVLYSVFTDFCMHRIAELLCESRLHKFVSHNAMHPIWPFILWHHFTKLLHFVNIIVHSLLKIN